MAINSELYLNEFIKKRLVPFIQEHHSDGKYIFWPDLATSHYAKLVTDWLNEQKIPFVPKTKNPANLPEGRPIEDFWAILKREVYMDAWTAQNVDQLETRIRYCLKKLDQIRRYGVQ